MSKKRQKIYDIIQSELNRQNGYLELIASETTSKAVLETAGSVLTNKYAEGYPGKDITVDAFMLTRQKI